MTQTNHTARRRLTALGLLLALLCSFVLAVPTQAATVEIKTLDQANAALQNGASRGIDVSKWNGSINWSQVAEDNVSFVFARASIGEEIDETFVYNATNAHSNGIKVGAYHYCKWTDRASMLKEAEVFISQLKRVNITFPVAVDIEANRGMNKSTLTGLAIEYMDLLKAAGYTPMVYSYTNFINAYIDLSKVDAAGYKYWVANYLTEPNVGQAVWQHTSYGSVRGISGRVDINVAYEALGSGNRITVDSTVSRSIKETLNQRYNVGLPYDSLNMTDMNAAVVTGLQAEIGRQWDMAFPITGVMDERTMEYLESINFVRGQTGGNITYLIQVKLFYRGHYTGSLTGDYDANTAEAIAAFQRASGLTADGEITRATLNALLW